MSNHLLEVEDLAVEFHTGAGIVEADPTRAFVR